MKLYKLGSNIIIITIVFNFLYTWYYGWNTEPISELEKTLDVICKYAIEIGIVCLIIPGLKLYKYNIEKYEKEEKEREKDKTIPWYKHEESGKHSD
jgi:hypothetical protein